MPLSRSVTGHLLLPPLVVVRLLVPIRIIVPVFHRVSLVASVRNVSVVVELVRRHRLRVPIVCVVSLRDVGVGVSVSVPPTA